MMTQSAPANTRAPTPGRSQVLVVTEEGFSWFLVASALDRRSVVLEWCRSPQDVLSSCRDFQPDLVVIGEVGTTAPAMLAAAQTTAGAGYRTVILTQPGRTVTEEQAIEAGAIGVISVSGGGDELRSRLLDACGLATAREPRVRMARPARLVLADQDLATTTVDLGVGGAALRTSTHVPSGAAGDLEIELSGDNRLRTRVEVLRSHGGVTAVRFLDLGREDRERLQTIVHRGARELPALVEGVPRILDMLLQARRGIVEGEPTGPMPEAWLTPVLSELPEDERAILQAWDPSAWTTHSEVDDDRALLLGVRLALSYCAGRLAQWASLAASTRERLGEAIRANLASAERVFKEAALRAAGRPRPADVEADPLERSQRALLQVALPLRDQWNRLAGDVPVPAFPALRGADDYFRSARPGSVRYDPAAFRSRDRTPIRVEFSAVSVSEERWSWLRQRIRRPAIAGSLVLAAALLGVATWLLRDPVGQLAETGLPRLSDPGPVQSVKVQGNPPALLVATVDGDAWKAMNDASRARVRRRLAEQMRVLNVPRVLVVDTKGHPVDLFTSTEPAWPAPTPSR